MEVLPQGTLLNEESILAILDRLHAGESLNEIFDPSTTIYPRFAFAEFIRAVRTNSRFGEIFEGIQVLRAFAVRRKIEEIAATATDPDERIFLTGKRLQFDALRHLETSFDPLSRRDEGNEAGVIQAAVVLMPPKAAKGLTGELKPMLEGQEHLQIAAPSEPTRDDDS